MKKSFLRPLAERGGEFSLSAFWLSVTMAVTLALTKNRREIMISRPATKAAPSSGTAHVLPDPAALHLFDRASGARIAGDADARRVQGAA